MKIFLVLDFQIEFTSSEEIIWTDFVKEYISIVYCYIPRCSSLKTQSLMILHSGRNLADWCFCWSVLGSVLHLHCLEASLELKGPEWLNSDISISVDEYSHPGTSQTPLLIKYIYCSISLFTRLSVFLWGKDKSYYFIFTSFPG